MTDLHREDWTGTIDGATTSGPGTVDVTVWPRSVSERGRLLLPHPRVAVPVDMRQIPAHAWLGARVRVRVTVELLDPVPMGEGAPRIGDRVMFTGTLGLEDGGLRTGGGQDGREEHMSDEPEAPYVCPGCHAVGGERCAYGCPDDEMRRRLESEENGETDDDQIDTDHRWDQA